MALFLDLINVSAAKTEYLRKKSTMDPYIGPGLFPPIKTRGLHLKSYLKNIEVTKSLAPSSFDAWATLRSRQGLEVTEHNMGLFREGYQFREEHLMEIEEAQAQPDARLLQLISEIYDDVSDLVEASEMVPERMIFQLLSAINGEMGIKIYENNTKYEWNFDPDKKWKASNWKDNSTDPWSNPKSKPISQIKEVKRQANRTYGTRLAYAIANPETIDNLYQNEEVLQGIPITQVISTTPTLADDFLLQVAQSLAGITFIPYDKQYRDADGVLHYFMPPGIVALIPAGPLGNTYYSRTPEEIRIAALNDKYANVEIVGPGIALCQFMSPHPVNEQINASLITLPVFNQMRNVYVMDVGFSSTQASGASLGGTSAPLSNFSDPETVSELKSVQSMKNDELVAEANEAKIDPAIYTTDGKINRGALVSAVSQARKPSSEE